jgi:hypothetical protein
VADCCECGDEPSGSCAMELVSYLRETSKKASCDHGNESTGSIKDGAFLDWLSDH